MYSGHVVENKESACAMNTLPGYCRGAKGKWVVREKTLTHTSKDAKNAVKKEASTILSEQQNLMNKF